MEALYLAELGRSGSLKELDGWAVMLKDPNGSRLAIASGILHSQEARTRLVLGWYLTFLQRPASNGEEQSWVDKLAVQSREQVLSQILGSAEYFSNPHISTGSPNESYIRSLFFLLLNRRPDSKELSGWLATLASIGREKVALRILQSFEFRFITVTGFYVELLHRNPDRSEVLGWANSGQDIASIRLGIESSTEFFLKS